MTKTKAFQIRMTSEQWQIISSFAERIGMKICNVMIEGALHYIEQKEKLLGRLSKSVSDKT